jgi:hypothetical protein
MVGVHLEDLLALCIDGVRYFSITQFSGRFAAPLPEVTSLSSTV